MALPSITQNPVRFGKVTWTALASLVDSLVDPDDYPDEVSIEGLVIFKPSTSAIVYSTAVPKYTRILANRTVNLVDAQIDEQGRKYVKLEANVLGANPAVLTWTATFVVSYSGVVIRLPDAKFTLAPNDEIDLTDYIDPGASPTTIPGITLTALQQMIQEYGSDFVTHQELSDEINAHITSADLLDKPTADQYYAPVSGSGSPAQVRSLAVALSVIGL